MTLQYKDANLATQPLKTTLDDGEHVPHHIIDVLPALAAGTNNIGDVDVASLPALAQLPATLGQKAVGASLSFVLASGHSPITVTQSGTVTVDGAVSLSAALPAGSNTIGNVVVNTLPAIGQLPATLGPQLSVASLSVTLATDEGDIPVSFGALPSGTNTIGNVGVTSLPTIPAGSNNIGDVDVLTLPALAQLPAVLGSAISAASLSVVLASDHAAVPVSLGAALPAGTNAIGKLAANSGVVIGTVELQATPAANLVTLAGAISSSRMAVDLATTPTANLATIASDTTFLRTYNPALPAGTNAIGKLSANSGVVIGAVELQATPLANLATLAGAVSSSRMAVDLPTLPTSGFGFQATVGTGEAQLTANAITVGAVLKADDDNTDSIYFRYSTGVLTTNGFRLKPGQQAPCPVSNTNKIYCISGTSSQKVHCQGA